MKILILANNDIGLYQFRKELIKELLKDNNVYLSLPFGELVDPLRKMGCRFIDTPVDRRGINPITDLKLLLNYHKIIKKIKPDLVITYTIKPNVYGGFICRLKHIPYAINITGLGTAFQNNGVLRKVVTLMYKVSCKKAKVVFFENEGNKQIFIENNILLNKQCCLLNGAGVNLDHYQVTEYPDGDTTKFLFVGRVMKEKGIDELFTATKKLIEEGIPCSLDILGSYEEDYKTVIEKYEAEGWLRYHGYQKDVRPFIAESHCFVLPSWHEGMANTNLECAASGRPVITSNIHGCLESVENGVSGFLVEKRDPESLYSAMKHFVELTYEDKKNMGIAGRKRMEKLFDKRTIVKETIRKISE